LQNMMDHHLEDINTMKHIYDKITKLFEGSHMVGSGNNTLDDYQASDGRIYTIDYTYNANGTFYQATREQPGSSDSSIDIGSMTVSIYNPQTEDHDDVDINTLTPELQQELMNAAEEHAVEHDIAWQDYEPDYDVD